MQDNATSNSSGHLRQRTRAKPACLTPQAPIEILLVEDSPGDADLAREALEGAKVRNNLHAVADGDEAMLFVRRQGRHANAPRPGMILLDLNLTKKDGREVLAKIKRDEDLKRIPVVAFTISKDEEDVSGRTTCTPTASSRSRSTSASS